MSNYDPAVSNGTCYTWINAQAPGNYIPCGNTAFGAQTCCAVGNICLEDQACWDPASGNTYVAGCTDTTWSDSSCPFKGTVYDSYYWIGIFHCTSADSSGNVAWCGCENDANPSTLAKLPSASCVSTAAPTILSAPTALAATATLPNSAGGKLTWASGFSPVTTLPSKASPTPSPTTPTTTTIPTTPSPTPTPTPTTTTQDTTTTPTSTPTTTTPSSTLTTLTTTRTPSSAPSSPSITLTTTTTTSTTTDATSPASTQTTTTYPTTNGGGGSGDSTTGNTIRPTTAAISTVQTSSSTSSAPSPGPTGDQLSTGAKAGIGVGAAAGAILIGLVGLLWCLLLRKRRREEQQDMPEFVPVGGGPQPYVAETAQPWKTHHSYQSQTTAVNTPSPGPGETFTAFQAELPAERWTPAPQEMYAENPHGISPQRQQGLHYEGQNPQDLQYGAFSPSGEHFQGHGTPVSQGTGFSAAGGDEAYGGGQLSPYSNGTPSPQPRLHPTTMQPGGGTRPQMGRVSELHG